MTLWDGRDTSALAARPRRAPWAAPVPVVAFHCDRPPGERDCNLYRQTQCGKYETLCRSGKWQLTRLQEDRNSPPNLEFLVRLSRIRIGSTDAISESAKVWAREPGGIPGRSDDANVRPVHDRLENLIGGMIEDIIRVNVAVEHVVHWQREDV